jgi:tetratricopeptide (TPR) repeat protein
MDDRSVGTMTDRLQKRIERKFPVRADMGSLSGCNLFCVLLVAGVGAAVGQAGDAAALIESGHWKQARSVVEARLREAPDDAAAYFYLSQIRNAFGDRSTPLALAEKAVALDGSVARYHRQVAEVTGVMAQHANAFQQMLLARRFRKEIDRALALDPRDVQAHRDLLEYYLLAPAIVGGDRQKAQEMAQRIARLDAAEGCLAEARVAEFEKRFAEAAGWLKKATEAGPPSYRARIVLARFDLAAQHFDPGPAEMAARDALRLDPGRADAYGILAEVYARESRWSELTAVLGDSARQVPDDRIAWYRAAVTLIDGGREWQRAGQYLRMYLGQEPEGNEPTLAEARRELARVSAGTDDHAAADGAPLYDVVGVKRRDIPRPFDRF